MILRALFPLFLSISAFATPLPSDEVYEKMKNLGSQTDRHPFAGNKFEISANLPTQKPAGGGKQEVSTHLSAFYEKNDQVVKQITFTTTTCKVTEKDLDKTAMQARVSGLIKLVSHEFFGQPFELDGARYFKELGPVWWKSVAVKIREPHPGVRSMRIARGVSKCDARGGYYFRYDFYL